MLDKDILEIVELLQLDELMDAGLVSDIEWIKRYHILKNKYSEEDVQSVSITGAVKLFGDVTGHLQKQRCTNKQCGIVFRSADISCTCDVCYSPALRIVE